MIFTETKLKGAFIIDIERREDSRGFFARAFCQHEFEQHGLKPVIAQANIAFNHKKGTLRGMHFQFPPAPETKLVRATRGAILDIIVDLRPESPTYLQHVAVELSEDNNRALYVPGALRARIPGAAGQDRDQLSGRRVLHARLRRRVDVQRSPAGIAVAVAGVGDFGEGRSLEAAGRTGSRSQAAHEPGAEEPASVGSGKNGK